MKIPKKYSKEWLKRIVEEAHKIEHLQPALAMLLKDMDEYIANLDKRYANCGKSKNAKRKKASAENGRKGGRPRKKIHLQTLPVQIHDRIF